LSTLLTIDQAWKLLGTCAGILFLLYWLKPRALRIVVPSLALWRQHLGHRTNPRWRERLALVLQLIAAALILRSLIQEPVPDVAAIIDPSIPVVAVIDGSGSMRAAGRLEAAAQAARALGGGLVLAGEQVRFLAQPDGSDLERGLAQLTTGVGNVDLAAAVTAVRAQGHRPVVLSDRDLDGLFVEGSVVESSVVGGPTSDVAVQEITATTGSGLPPKLQVAVRVANHSDLPTKVTLLLGAPDKRLGSRRLSLAPDEVQVARFTLDPIDVPWVQASLVDHSDDLPDNDVSFALLPSLRAARVELVGPGNRYLERVLAAMPGVQVRVSPPGSWRMPSIPVDLVIFDRCGPIRTLNLPSVYVDPPAGLGPWPVGEAVVDPVFRRWDYAHPVLQGVSLRHLTVEQARPLQIDDDTRVLAAIAEGPVVAVKDDFPRQLVIGFDLTRSDLPLSVAFPQLIYNILLWARSDAVGEPQPRARTTTRGIPLADVGPSRIRSLSGKGHWAPPLGLPQLVGLPPGVYEVETDTETTRVALYWDPQEHGRTDTGEQVQALAEASEPLPEQEPEKRPWWMVLAFGVLLIEFGVAPR
jgi:hypothetical protein